MNKKIQKNKGMSYVELIVVLSIFAALSSVVMFNYGDFQDRVDIKNLASDIAMKIVEAQKSSIDGKYYSGVGINWKPAYGVYFDIGTNNKQFIYFADLDNDNNYLPGEETEPPLIITKNNKIDRIDRCTDNDCSSPNPINNSLHIVFTRPNSGASFAFAGPPITGSDYVQITVLSPKGAKSLIKVYLSGRVQVN